MHTNSAFVLRFVAALLLHGFSGAAEEPPGARVSFITYEAEAAANRTTGKVVHLAEKPSRTASSPELEASGRGYVELTKPRDAVEFRAAAPANTIVIRHCIPDAPTGGGMTATLSLFVNGQPRQSLELSSRHNWLYGPEGENGMSNDPSAGQPHVFWEEERYIITGPPLRAGDALRLQKEAKDTAAFYRIDLIDLELAAAVPPPAAGSFLSAADFGANGTDDKDDTDAIAKCIAAAKQQGKIAWLPRGRYIQTKRFELEGVTFQGEGMWLTSLIGNTPSDTFAGELGFTIRGDGSKIRDLYMDSYIGTSRKSTGTTVSGNDATGWLLENLWVTHTNTGFWLGSDKGVIRGCRVRFTYADGININSGSSDNLVEHNHVRGTGDDGLAILSESERNLPPSKGNTLRHNTSVATWWGHNCDLAGGSGHVVEDNYLADNPKFGCLTINLPNAFPMHPLSDSVLRRNTVVRGGGNYGGGHRGAIWTSALCTTVAGVKFEDNIILDSIFHGIQITGSKSQEISFARNLIERPGEHGIVIEPSTPGAATFTDNNVKSPARGLEPYANRASGSFSATLSGNSFR